MHTEKTGYFFDRITDLISLYTLIIFPLLLIFTNIGNVGIGYLFSKDFFNLPGYESLWYFLRFIYVFLIPITYYLLLINNILLRWNDFLININKPFNKFHGLNRLTKLLRIFILFFFTGFGIYFSPTTIKEKIKFSYYWLIAIMVISLSAFYLRYVLNQKLSSEIIVLNGDVLYIIIPFIFSLLFSSIIFSKYDEI